MWILKRNIRLCAATVAGQPAAACVPAPLPGCAEAIAYSEANSGVALLILEDSKVRCRWADIVTPQELWSGTKSLVGLMAAAGAQDGVLTLDERASATLAQCRGDPKKEQI